MTDAEHPSTTPRPTTRGAVPPARAARRVQLLAGALVGSLALAGGLYLVDARAATTTTTLVPTADTYASPIAPTTAHGTLAYLKASTGGYRAYLAFDLSKLSGTVSGASLKLYSNGAAVTGPFTVASTTAFDEATLTAATTPALGATVGTFASVKKNAWVTVPLAAGTVATGKAAYLAVTGGTATVAQFASREALNKPQLVVTYDTATTTTTVPPTTTTTPPTTTTTVPPTTTTTTTTVPPAAAQPPAAVTGGTAWDLMFTDEFDSATYTASKWSNGMRSGATTLADNFELQQYVPGASVVGTDTDQTGKAISVLRQTATKTPTATKFYEVRAICRLYPVAAYPQYYNAAVDNTCSTVDATGKTVWTDNRNATLVPYQFTSGMLNNAKSFAFKGGYAEARVKFPKGFSMWPAFWLRDWQSWSYEIDAMEGFDGSAHVTRSTYWWGNGSHNSHESSIGDIGLLTTGGTCTGRAPLPATTSTAGKCSLANSVDLSQGYHTIGVNWLPKQKDASGTVTDPGRYEFFLDGIKYWTSPAGADIDGAYNHLIINLAMGNSRWEFDWLNSGLNPGLTKPFDINLTDTTKYKPTVEWDYVKVWQAPNAHNICTTGSCPN